MKHDGITPAGVDAQDDRMEIYLRDRGICQGCGEPVPWGEFEIAHRICNAKHTRKKYGAKVIDSPYNKAITHRGRCNDLLNCANNPAKCQEIVDLVMGVDND